MSQGRRVGVRGGGRLEGRSRQAAGGSGTGTVPPQRTRPRGRTGRRPPPRRRLARTSRRTGCSRTGGSDSAGGRPAGGLPAPASGRQGGAPHSAPGLSVPVPPFVLGALRSAASRASPNRSRWTGRRRKGRPAVRRAWGGRGAPGGGQRPRLESPPRPLRAGHAAGRQGSGRRPCRPGFGGQGASDRCGRPGGGRRRGVGVRCSGVWCGSSAADLVPGTWLSRHPQGPRRDPTPHVTAGARGGARATCRGPPPRSLGDPASPCCGHPPPPAADAGGVIGRGHRSSLTWPRTWPQTARRAGATPGPKLLLGELGGPAWDRVALLASVTCKPPARLKGRRPGHYEGRGPSKVGTGRPGLAGALRGGA